MLRRYRTPRARAGRRLVGGERRKRRGALAWRRSGGPRARSSAVMLVARLRVFSTARPAWVVPIHIGGPRRPELDHGQAEVVRAPNSFFQIV